MSLRFVLFLLLLVPTLNFSGSAQEQDDGAGQLAALEARVAELEAVNSALIQRLTDIEAADAAAFASRVRAVLMDDPALVLAAIEALREQRVAETAQTYQKELSSDLYLPVLGNPAGDVTLVEYFDYNCGYCRQTMGDLLALVEADGNIRLLLKDLPFLSDQSVEAAVMALAAVQEGVDYLALHRLAMTSDGTVDGKVILEYAAQLGGDSAAIEARLGANRESYINYLGDAIEVANALEITGTPAFFIEGKVIPGAVSRDQLENTIAEVRALNADG